MGNASSNQLQVVATEEAAIETLLFDVHRHTLVAFSKDLMLVQHTVDPNTGAVTKSTEAKLAGREMSGACWVGPSILAIGTNQNSVRLWDLDDNELSMLQIKSASSRIVSVASDMTQGLLVGGCDDGAIYVWQFQGDKVENAESFSDKWEQWPGIGVESCGEFSDVLIGGGKGSIAVQGNAGVSILRRQSMNTAFGGNTSAVQVSGSRVVVQSEEMATNLETDITIKGLSANGNFIAIWSGQQAGIYELIKAHKVTRSVGVFKSDSMNVQVLNETAFVMNGPNVLGLSYTGSTKQQLRVHESDSPVTSIDVNNEFLAAATAGCHIIVWDMAKHQARQVCPAKCVSDDVDVVKNVKVNATGTLVSFLAETGGKDDSSIWIWDTVSNAIHTFDFAPTHRVPISHHWEASEAQLLAVEATESTEEEGGRADAVSNEAVTMFVTAEDGVIVQHRIGLSHTDGALIGIQVPFLIHVDKSSSAEGGAIVRATSKRVIPSFDGLEGASADVKAAMMQFSFNLAINNMDEAFKAVRAIKNKKVWESMAKMCVQSKRIDVAGVCIGSMGNAVGARALRESAKDEEPEAQAACLASHLGMNDVAEQLYKESGRYDLLNTFYQNSGRWEEALEVAKRHDRPHLRLTHYNYGKFLEGCGKMKEAERRYEASLTHNFEVPRMYSDDPDQLENYISRSGSKKLQKWWAQYLESQGVDFMPRALEYYERADDALSLARVHCYCGDMEKAKEVVDTTGNAAAAYHLARQYENQERIEDAIAYYEKAGCYNSAIRIAKENGRREDIGRLALMSTKNDMIEVATFYESEGMVDKAVELYHKGGRVGHALSLCFEHNLTDEMPEDLTQINDPALLRQAADFFIKRAKFDKAVNLLLTSKEYEEAVEICRAQQVFVTDELAEKFTLEKGDDNSFRNMILEKVAECCVDQGSFQLATQKFTQAGNKVKAMKALLKCADTGKIIFYAQKCRSKDIYIMAANYLQTLDWRNDSDIMTNITVFYTKGKALEKLSHFYEVCAQNEIDEYQSYDKALTALKEAQKCLNKARMKDRDEQEQRLHSLQTKIVLIERFVSIRALAETEPGEMLNLAEQLLREPDLETALQIGDVYGVMVEQLALNQNFQGAYDMMRQMRDRIPNVNMAYYINQQTIETVENTLGIPKGHGRGAEEHGGGGDGGDGGGGGGGSGVSRGADLDDDDDGIEEDVVERPATAHGMAARKFDEAMDGNRMSEA